MTHLGIVGEDEEGVVGNNRDERASIVPIDFLWRNFNSADHSGCAPVIEDQKFRRFNSAFIKNLVRRCLLDY